MSTQATVSVLKSRVLPLELYVPDLDVPSQEMLFYRVDITGSKDPDLWVRGLEDILCKVDDVYAKRERRGGKRVDLACAKFGNGRKEVRSRVARFIPYPLLTVNRIKRLRSEAYQVLRPYMITQELEAKTGSGDVTKKQHYLPTANLVEAFGALDKLNQEVVLAEIRKKLEAFERTRHYARIFEYIEETGFKVPEIPHKVFPLISLSANPLGVFSESFHRFLDEKKRKAIQDADKKALELLARVEDEANRKRAEVLKTIDGDLRSRLSEIMTKLAELAANGGKNSMNSLRATSRRAEQLSNLAASLGFGDVIKESLGVVETTSKAILSGDTAKLLESSKRFAESCGFTPRASAAENFQLGVRKLRGGRFFLNVIE